MNKSHKQTYEVKVVVTNPKTKKEAEAMIKELSDKLRYTLSTIKLEKSNEKRG